MRKICSSQPQCGCKHSAVKISSFLFSRTKNIPRTGWRMSEYGFSPRKRMRYKSWRFWFIAPSSIQMTVVFLSPPSLYRHHYHHHSYHLHAHLTSVEMDTDLNWGNQKSSIPTIRPSLHLTEGSSCIMCFFLWEYVTRDSNEYKYMIEFRNGYFRFLLFSLVSGHWIVWIAFKIIIAYFT